MGLLENGQIQIHTENIFPIIKKAVYSDHEIFLRELISNSVDAISKRRMAAMSGDCPDSEDGKIDLKINKENKTITISDNGIGMSADEVREYINQVAFSSAEQFLKKYDQGNDQIIGHFGLGFYSSFMVSSNVELTTLSATDNHQAVKWSCDGTPNFSLEEASRETPGTDVVLHLLEEEEEYLEPSRIKNLIKKYCDFMPVQILLEGEVVNKRNPTWRKNSNELKDQDYIDLYRYLYPFQGDPLLWIHLNTDYPYTLQGILYFPKTTGRADWEKGEIKLYCNQVFVSDSIKEVVPSYLLPLRGVIDSPDIPLNVSRSALQTDRRVRSIGNFIAKKVADKLKNLLDTNPNFYVEIWDQISPFIKIGSMQDEKFAEQVEDLIIYSTTYDSNVSKNEDFSEIITHNEGSYTTIKGYINRLSEGSDKKILYCTDELSQAGALNLWKSQGSEILKAETVVDTQFIPWLESRREEITFVRVDSELGNNLNDENKELVGPEGETTTESIRKLIKDAVADEKVTIQVQNLKGKDSPPALILLPEQMRRINDMGALMDQRLPGLPEHHVLLVNKNHPLVEGLAKLNSGSIVVGTNNSPSEILSKKLALHIYQLAKLGVGGLDPNEIAAFPEKTADLMGQLLDRSLS